MFHCAANSARFRWGGRRQWTSTSCPRRCNALVSPWVKVSRGTGKPMVTYQIFTDVSSCWLSRRLLLALGFSSQDKRLHPCRSWDFLASRILRTQQVHDEVNTHHLAAH